MGEDIFELKDAFRFQEKELTATTEWRKCWTNRRYNYDELIPVLYGDPIGRARFEFTFDTDDAIEAQTPAKEQWGLGDRTVNNSGDCPLVANDVLPAGPTGYRVVVSSGAVHYVLVGR